MLPNSPVTVTQTIPSYLYFQYIDDPDLPALIESYNNQTQGYVDWFANVSLPVYTGLSGPLLDWIGQGIYGLPRPNLSSFKVKSMVGPIATLANHGPPGPDGPTPNIANAIASLQIYGGATDYQTPDDIYQRILTWWFYKGDGRVFSVPWLKRRMSRFLYGYNGKDIFEVCNPGISVVFNQATTPLPTCQITLVSADLPVSSTLLTYLQLSIENGVLLLPFQFEYTVTIV